MIRRQIWRKLNEVKGPAIEYADADYPETAVKEKVDSSQALSSCDGHSSEDETHWLQLLQYL